MPPRLCVLDDPDRRQTDRLPRPRTGGAVAHAAPASADEQRRRPEVVCAGAVVGNAGGRAGGEPRAAPAREKRGHDWRPGGAHKDPRDRFKKGGKRRDPSTRANGPEGQERPLGVRRRPDRSRGATSPQCRAPRTPAVARQTSRHPAPPVPSHGATILAVAAPPRTPTMARQTRRAATTRRPALAGSPERDAARRRTRTPSSATSG